MWPRKLAKIATTVNSILKNPMFGLIYSLGQKFKTTFCNITHLSKKASYSRKTKYCCVRMHI